MRIHGLTWKAKPRFIHTTDSNYSYNVYPNLLKDCKLTDVHEVYSRMRLHPGIQYLQVEEFGTILNDSQNRKELGQINLAFIS
jgi:hypothetical protein